MDKSWSLVFGAQLAAVALGCINPGKCEESLGHYHLSRDALVCIVDHESDLMKMTSALIILDISKCPPAGVQSSQLIDIQSSASPTNKMSFGPTNAGLDSLLILKLSQLPCYIDTAKELVKQGQNPIQANFTNCLAK